MGCTPIAPRDDVSPPPLLSAAIINPPSASAPGALVDPPPAAEIAASIVDLDVPGHKPAVVTAPKRTAHARLPLVVATHGADGTPEAHCSFWRSVVSDRAFVLCPRGVTSDVYAPPEKRGYFYPSHPALGREVEAALAALTARFGDEVDVRGAVYAGFSQGATMGALALGPKPSPFRALVLVEGGYDDWDLFAARAFSRGGGERVAFVCGRPVCVEGARKSIAYLARHGVAAELRHASGAGHRIDGAVGVESSRGLAWATEGDARWH